jgi:hypothetical protein
MLAQVNNKPTHGAFTCAKTVLSYLGHTINHGIHYRSEVPTMINYSDADFASDAHPTNQRRSRSGNLITLAGGPIWWHTKRQTITAQSSTESELIALHSLSEQLTWFQRLLDETGISEKLKLKTQTLLVDNQSTIAMIRSDGPTNRSKHIDIKYFGIKDKLRRGTQGLRYVASSDNAADIFTKHSSTQQFNHLRSIMGIHPRPIQDCGGALD